MFSPYNSLYYAKSALGCDYKFGAKWPMLYDAYLTGKPIDCSGFAVWVFWCGGLSLGDSKNINAEDLYNLTVPITNPQPCDVGFLRTNDGHIHHIIIRYNDKYVIEARGEPYNHVIFRPDEAWEKQKGFTGWRRFKALMENNNA